MSFDFKGPSFRPMIQESQQMKNNGGGGNLGYFQRQNGEEEKKKEDSVDVFNGEEKDSFELSLQIPEEGQSIINAIKNFFNSLMLKIKSFFEAQENPFN